MIETVVSFAPDPGVLAPTALIVAAPNRMDAHARAIEAAGARLIDRVEPVAMAARIDMQIRLDIVLFDATGVGHLEAADAADALASRHDARHCRIVALLDAAAIDAVAPPLLNRCTALLCDASPAQYAAALVAVMAEPGARLHDATHEREAERLRMLNDEVARLAEVLTQLSAERPGGVRDRANSFRAEPAIEPDPDPRVVRSTIRARRLRDQHFPSELFADPAWDMLLDLYAARLEGRRVSVSSLCIAAAVPPTTALRWIGTLHDANLFGREADPTDKRRAHITLTEHATGGMRGYFAAAARAGLAAG
ncbi:hypothetical protein [Sphingomonas sp. LT1P40]|uniref:hypothetical protein n=1 Tax=Alteristakelama amylovorans TaxID=3096166 RepID=UPI002FC5AF1A